MSCVSFIDCFIMGCGEFLWIELVFYHTYKVRLGITVHKFAKNSVVKQNKIWIWWQQISVICFGNISINRNGKNWLTKYAYGILCIFSNYISHICFCLFAGLYFNIVRNKSEWRTVPLKVFLSFKLLLR